MKSVKFRQAVPVRPAGCPDDRSDVFIFTAQLPAGRSKLFIGGHSVYRIRLNGVFLGFGPARAPHGYARIDCFDLTAFEAENLLEIELFHESCPTYFIPAGELFLIAEVIGENGNVLLATGREGDFVCRRDNRRYFTDCKHSDQRFSMECWDFSASEPEFFQLENAGTPEFIERHSPMPDNDEIIAADFCGESTVGKLPEVRHEMCVKRYEPGFKEGFVLSNWRFHGVKTGFLKFHFKAVKDVLFHIIYGETLPEEGILNHNVWWGNYIIPIRMSAGQEMDFECFDLHTLQFCSVVYAPGALEVSRCSLREYAFPRSLIHNPYPDDPIAVAAVETFRQCTVDVFSDCPDRERAAWLCDSFFNARTSFFLTGSTLVEEAFIDNFMLSPEVLTAGRRGLFPMCYPADITDNIPQWTLWFILELDEYLRVRKGKINYPQLYKERIMQVFEWFDTYLNPDGLLENIPGWNFIDCSEASNFVSGVNYPTNLLYAAALDVAGAWYDEPLMKHKAAVIRRLTRQNGMLNGRLRDCSTADVSSEAAQYYALYFGGNDFPEISLASAGDTPYQCGLLMAKMMRYELLYREGGYSVLQEELKRDFMPLIERTGTFWEKLFDAKPWYEQTSCCHCFATAVILWCGSRNVEKINV